MVVSPNIYFKQVVWGSRTNTNSSITPPPALGREHLVAASPKNNMTMTLSGGLQWPNPVKRYSKCIKTSKCPKWAYITQQFRTKQRKLNSMEIPSHLSSKEFPRKHFPLSKNHNEMLPLKTYCRWWLNHPFKKYARQIGSFPRFSG